jgi:hypothetical protein
MRDGLIKVQSRSALLRMLLVYARGYLNSVLRNKFLILGINHSHILHLRKEGRENS